MNRPDYLIDAKEKLALYEKRPTDYLVLASVAYSLIEVVEVLREGVGILQDICEKLEDMRVSLREK